MFGFVLCLATALSVRPPVLAVPDAVGKVSAYATEHGPALLKAFVRTRLLEQNPNAVINDETLDATAGPLIASMMNMHASEQQTYLQGVHDRITKRRTE